MFFDFEEKATVRSAEKNMGCLFVFDGWGQGVGCNEVWFQVVSKRVLKSCQAADLMLM